MAKVLTEEDFEEGATPKGKEDTTTKEPPADEIIVGKEKEEVPPKKEEPAEGGEESQPKSSDDKKYKHKTWDETEKARVELERGFTEKAMENSRLKRELDEVKKPKEPIVTIDDRIKEMTRETLGKIRTLPSDSSTREDDAGYLWAKLQSDISDVKYEEREKKQTDQRSVAKRLYDHAGKEGLKTEDELDMVGLEFQRTDSRLPVEDRVSSAVETTKGRISRLREGLAEKQKKDEKDKEDLKVLGRGSSRREKSEEEDKRPTSMSQQLAELNEKRKLGKEDLRY